MSNQNLRNFKQLRHFDRIWLILPLFLSFLLLSLATLREGDLWWHIKVGEEIFRLNGIPQTDTFSYTAFGLPFYFTRSWLSGLILFFLYKVGGLPTLVLIQAFVGTIIIGILMLISLVRSENVKIASIAVTLGFLGLYPFSTARPVIFSFLCFALFLWVLYTFRYSGRNHLWLLPVIMVAWVNLNSAWLTGLFLLGVFTAFNLIEVVVRKEKFLKIRALILWSLLTFLAIFINPLGLGILEDLITATSHPVNQLYVSEWQPTTITLTFAWPFFLIIGLLLISLAYSKNKPDWIELLLVLTFIGLSMRYIRLLPFFYMIVVPTLAFIGSGLSIKEKEIYKTLDEEDGEKSKPVKHRFNQLILIGMLLAIIISLPQIRQSLFGLSDTDLVDSYFPIGASEYLNTQSTDGIRLFSQPEWGGFLIWRHNPQMKVFIDGRVEQFPLLVWEDYYHIITAGVHWLDLLEDYEVDYLILSRERHGKLIDNIHQAGLVCPYEDSTSLVCLIQD